jgi:hypothetical protein
MITTISPYKSGRQTGRNGFWQQLRAEFTKLRTVRGWVIALIGVAALTVVFPPGQFHSQNVPLATRQCAGKSVLSVDSVHPERAFRASLPASRRL